MPDRQVLPHILALLGDDSPKVREQVRETLLSFGEQLPELLSELSVPLSAEQRVELEPILRQQSFRALLRAWPEWSRISRDAERLEAGLVLLSSFLSGIGPSRSKLGASLDAFAEEFRRAHPKGDALSLARFLFVEKDLRGNREDYYELRNSDLDWVLREKRGLPISLACIFILVARRLGIEAEGFNFPGHFLARARVGKELILIDAFDQGRVLADEVIVIGQTTMGRSAAVDLVADARIIVIRCLRNMANAYARLGDREGESMMSELIDLSL